MRNNNRTSEPNFKQNRYRTENNRSEKQQMNDRYYSSRDQESNDQDYRDQYQSYTRGASPSDSPSYETGSDYGYGRDQYRNSNSVDRETSGRWNADRNFGNNDRDSQSYSQNNRYQGMNSGYNYNSETAPTSYGERFSSRHAYDEANASDQPRSNYSSRFDQFSRTGSYNPAQNDREFTRESQGQHFGKGPKNYKRADTRIQEEVCDALTHDSEVDASEIEVSVKEGIVTLSGTVSERSMKRAAEDCAERVSGVTDVKNEISTQSRLSKTTGTQSAGKNKTGSSTSNFM